MSDAQDTHTLRELVHAFRNASILCIGDVMLDRFVYGKVERISPEAPVPVFHIQRELQSLGGAGNVVHNLASLGVNVAFASVVGKDECGKQIMSLLETHPHVTAFLYQDQARVSTLKTRYIASGQQMLRADNEQGNPVDEKAMQALKDFITCKIREVSLVILSDYGKGILNPDLISWVIEKAHQQGLKVIVDPKGSDYSIYRNADVITPNARELAQASRMATSSDEQVVKASNHIISTCGIQTILATRGEKGMTLVEKNHAQPIHIPTQALEVYDVSGAGDTVIAVLGACLSLNASLHASATLSNMAAGVVVAKVGTASLTPEELLGALERIPHSCTTDKVTSATEGARKILEWHRKGLRVGFTNGCFDLLHPGHISLIQQAKKACDRLVVGLNSDLSVQRLKGAERPIQKEEARASLLAALADVDLVIIFGEDTPLSLIRDLRPDVLIKGSDYTVNEIVGAQDVLSWGGEVILAELKPGFSTTNTILNLNRTKQGN